MSPRAQVPLDVRDPVDSSPSTRHRFMLLGRHRLPFIVLFVIYAAVFGTLLLKTDSLPYITDNNESFSDLVHARNIAAYGVGNSFGLTDESYGPSAAGHPYVYTHSGNFPRLFAFVILSLGARTIESQIAITTLTVGLMAVLGGYLFFARIAGRGFALIVSIVFMTDY